jgi:hypothetical protein
MKKVHDMKFKDIVDWALLVAMGLAAYPLVKSDGIFDQYFGIWWLLAALIAGAICVGAYDFYERRKRRMR